MLENTLVFSSNFSTLLAGKEEQDDELQKIFAQGWPQMNTLLTADPPEHERFRVEVNALFTSARINKMYNLIEQIVDELIDSFIVQSKCEFVSEFAVPLPYILHLERANVNSLTKCQFSQVFNVL
ncbi:MAG: hypothetical protein PUP93_25445 [Rhizonema sp. NSF051]|nr:hypothetical protein [Rhizonema sp. NSF051]